MIFFGFLNFSVFNKFFNLKNLHFFFSITPWTSQFLSSFSTFRRVINYYSRFQGYITHWCHKLTETTDRWIVSKIRVQRCQETWIPMKFSTNYCRQHFIRVQLQSERLCSYYLKGLEESGAVTLYLTNHETIRR